MYSIEHIRNKITALVRNNVSNEVWTWLNNSIRENNTEIQVNTTFVSIPRKTGKLVVSPQGNEVYDNWTVDRLSRVWLLMNIVPKEKEAYIRQIEQLFRVADMNELVALYSALPVLAYPEEWSRRCSEGIRNNISNVLEAVICDNPYPASFLTEAAWNQLVLKAFFTGQPVHRIIGLDQRANLELANTLHDYAHERWSAGRPVNPELWRCVGPFIEAEIFPDIQKIFESGNRQEKQAAALACYNSNFAPAKDLLNQHKELLEAIESGTLSWQTIAMESSMEKTA